MASEGSRTAHVAGRQGGKTAASVEWMRADDRRVMLCPSDDRRDQMRSAYPDIDPSRFLGPHDPTKENR